jgi:hypothetical protein
MNHKGLIALVLLVVISVLHIRCSQHAVKVEKTEQQRRGAICIIRYPSIH